jgi:hypothetical protein
MKTKVITILAAAVIICFTTSELTAVEDKTFTSSGQILDGEVWNNVSIYNDDTIVDMLGGDVESIGTYDKSTVNVTGGQINTLAALEFSTANVSNGEVYSLSAWDSAIVNFSDDARALSLGSGGDFSTTNMYGGITEFLRAGDYGIINLYGGLVTDSLNSWGSATVNVFGYDLVKTISGGRYGYGQVFGFFADDSSFTIDFNTSETYTHINLIPEPSSLILLGLGVLILRRRI